MAIRQTSSVGIKIISQRCLSGPKYRIFSSLFSSMPNAVMPSLLSKESGDPTSKSERVGKAMLDPMASGDLMEDVVPTIVDIDAVAGLLSQPAILNIDEVLASLKVLDEKGSLLPAYVLMDTIETLADRKDCLRTELVLRLAAHNVGRHSTSSSDTNNMINIDGVQHMSKLISFAVGAFIQRAHIESAFLLWMRMASSGYVTDKKAMDILLDMASEKDPPPMAFVDHVHASMMRKNWVQPPIHYVRIIKILTLHLRASVRGFPQSIFQQQQNQQQHVSVKDFNITSTAVANLVDVIARFERIWAEASKPENGATVGESRSSSDVEMAALRIERVLFWAAACAAARAVRQLEASLRSRAGLAPPIAPSGSIPATVSGGVVYACENRCRQALVQALHDLLSIEGCSFLRVSENTADEEGGSHPASDSRDKFRSSGHAVSSSRVSMPSFGARRQKPLQPSGFTRRGLQQEIQLWIDKIHANQVSELFAHQSGRSAQANSVAATRCSHFVLEEDNDETMRVRMAVEECIAALCEAGDVSTAFELLEELVLPIVARELAFGSGQPPSLMNTTANAKSTISSVDNSRKDAEDLLALLRTQAYEPSESKPSLREDTRKPDDVSTWFRALLSDTLRSVALPTAQSSQEDRPQQCHKRLHSFAMQLMGLAQRAGVSLDSNFFSSWITALLPPDRPFVLSSYSPASSSFAKHLNEDDWKKSLAAAFRIIDTLEETIARSNEVSASLISMLCRHESPGAIGKARDLLLDIVYAVNADAKAQHPTSSVSSVSAIPVEPICVLLHASTLCSSAEAHSKLLDVVEQEVIGKNTAALSDPHILRARLYAHARLCRGLKTAQLLRALRHQNAPVDRPLYSWVITAIYLTFPMEEAEWRLVKNPVATSDWLLREMLRDGLQANAHTVASMLKLFGKATQITRQTKGLMKSARVELEQAVKFALRFSRAGHNGHSKVALNDLVVKEIVKVCCLAGEEERVLEIIDQIEKDYKLKATATWYEPIVHNYAVVLKKVSVAEDVVTIMVNKGLKISNRIVDSFVHAFLASDDVISALDWLQERFTESQARPSVDLCLALLETCLERGDVNEARRVVVVVEQMYSRQEREAAVFVPRTAKYASDFAGVFGNGVSKVQEGGEGRDESASAAEKLAGGKKWRSEDTRLEEYTGDMSQAPVLHGRLRKLRELAEGGGVASHALLGQSSLELVGLKAGVRGVEVGALSEAALDKRFRERGFRLRK